MVVSGRHSARIDTCRTSPRRLQLCAPALTHTVIATKRSPWVFVGEVEVSLQLLPGTQHHRTPGASFSCLEGIIALDSVFEILQCRERCLHRRSNNHVANLDVRPHSFQSPSCCRKSHPVLRSKAVPGTKSKAWQLPQIFSERRSHSHRLGSHPSSPTRTSVSEICPKFSSTTSRSSNWVSPPFRTRPRLSPFVVYILLGAWLLLASSTSRTGMWRSYRRRLPLLFLVLFATVAHLVVNLGAPAPGFSSCLPPQCVLVLFLCIFTHEPLCILVILALRRTSGSRPPS